jgi:hypothetical protein
MNRIPNYTVVPEYSPPVPTRQLRTEAPHQFACRNCHRRLRSGFGQGILRPDNAGQPEPKVISRRLLRLLVARDVRNFTLEQRRATLVSNQLADNSSNT